MLKFLMKKSPDSAHSLYETVSDGDECFTESTVFMLWFDLIAFISETKALWVVVIVDTKASIFWLYSFVIH